MGGIVTVTNNIGGDIITAGDRSGAIYAQSVGGGGGNGAATGGLVAIGGGGSSTGHGAEVDVANIGAIMMRTDAVDGVLGSDYGVARVRQNVMAGSDIGAIFMNRTSSLTGIRLSLEPGIL